MITFLSDADRTSFRPPVIYSIVKNLSGLVVNQKPSEADVTQLLQAGIYRLVATSIVKFMLLMLDI